MMTAIGNHERDWPGSGDAWVDVMDSGEPHNCCVLLNRFFENDHQAGSAQTEKVSVRLNATGMLQVANVACPTTCASLCHKTGLTSPGR